MLEINAYTPLITIFGNSSFENQKEWIKVLHAFQKGNSVIIDEDNPLYDFFYYGEDFSFYDCNNIIILIKVTQKSKMLELQCTEELKTYMKTRQFKELYNKFLMILL